MRAPLRALVLLIAALAATPVLLRAGTTALPPTLDPASRRALGFALHALKMTPADLSFQKTNAESRLVLPLARLFLDQPLALPLYADAAAAEFRAADSLADLARFGGRQLRPAGSGSPHAALRSPHLCPPQVVTMAQSISPRLASIVRELYDAVAPAAQQLQASLPADADQVLAAWGVLNLDLRRDPEELRAWEAAGLKTGPVQTLLQRVESLDLADGELEETIVAFANPPARLHPGRPTRDGPSWRVLGGADFLSRILTATPVVAAAVDNAVRELRSLIPTDPALQQPFQVECPTPLGRIILGGARPNTYTNEAFLIIDTGGDDLYANSAGGANGLAGRPVSIVIDCAGNDRYLSPHSFSQGAGLFGIGILVDLGGDDRYEAKHASQGTGLFGAGLLLDAGGQDTFTADTFAQGAACFGVGILWQRDGNTTYHVRQMGQGYGGVQGCALLLDGGGNDRYIAEGKLPCSWVAGHYFTLSQGFAQGLRPLAGGGIGILADLHGNDLYQADVYGQGASYWYSVGLLLDTEGDDTYQAQQYCQGAGIHLSTGGLFDWSGNDTYTAGAICQGAAHDYSVGMLIDGAGNDRYTGNTTAQGTAINTSFALLLDRAGDDTYTGTDPKQSQAAGHDGDKRECGSIALLLDLAGTDHYSQGQTNNTLWLKPWYGAGLDREPAGGRARQTATQPARGRPRPAYPVVRPLPEQTQPSLAPTHPADPHNPTELLLRRALRDAVTEAEQAETAAADADLKNRCLEVLPYVLSRTDSPDVMLRVKAEQLVDLASTNSVPALIAAIDAAPNDEVARVCCYFLARFETGTNAIPHVLPLLQRTRTKATALYTLGHLHAQEAFAPALAALGDRREMVRLRAAQALGRIGNPRALPRLIAALADPLWTVRYAAEDALVALGPASTPALHHAFRGTSSRARPHLVEALAKLGDPEAQRFADTLLRGQDPLLAAAVRQQLATYSEAAQRQHGAK